MQDTGPLTVRPDVWAQVDPDTTTRLVDAIQQLANTTTGPTALASLITSMALVIADRFPAQEWGQLCYDANMHIQNTLISEVVRRHTLDETPLTPADEAPAAPAPEPPAPTSKFSAGVGPAPRSGQ